MGVDRAVMLARAAPMRREPTEAERRLWRHLRGSQLAGYKFRRQTMIDGRIVDFFCPAKGVIVEIDGHTHEAAKDASSDRSMAKTHGFVTLRFSNTDIMENAEGVLQHFLTTLNSLPDRWAENTTPDPSSEEEGGAHFHD